MRKNMVVVEGSYAVAHAVKVCKPNVISAYPITPQTHIVEDLAQFHADGEINCEYIKCGVRILSYLSFDRSKRSRGKNILINHITGTCAYA